MKEVWIKGQKFKRSERWSDGVRVEGQQPYEDGDTHGSGGVVYKTEGGDKDDEDGGEINAINKNEPSKDY